MRVSQISNFYAGYKNNCSKVTSSRVAYANTLGVDTVSFKSKNDKNIQDVSSVFPNPIKMVFSDIDGTILDDGKVVETAVKAIRQLNEANIPLILTTGRGFDGILPLFEKLGLKPDYLITQNGSIILDKNGQKIYQNALSLEDTNSIVEIAQNYPDSNVHFRIVCDDGSYYVDHEEPPCQAMFPKKRVDSYDELWEKGLKPSKILFYKSDAESAEDVQDLAEYLKTNIPARLNIFKTNLRTFEIANAGVSKGNAVKFLINREGLELKDAAGLGDSQNDIEMMKTIKSGNGLTIGMGNGEEILKQEVEYLTANIKEDGYAEAISQILTLNKKFASANM